MSSFEVIYWGPTQSHEKVKYCMDWTSLYEFIQFVLYENELFKTSAHEGPPPIPKPNHWSGMHFPEPSLVY